MNTEQHCKSLWIGVSAKHRNCNCDDNSQWSLQRGEAEQTVSSYFPLQLFWLVSGETLWNLCSWCQWHVKSQQDTVVSILSRGTTCNYMGLSPCLWKFVGYFCLTVWSLDFKGLLLCLFCHAVIKHQSDSIWSEGQRHQASESINPFIRHTHTNCQTWRKCI